MRHIVIDLEVNSFKKNNRPSDVLMGEIIEIGAIMLDDDMNEVSEFKTYVRPEYADEIFPRIKKLTGITEKHVEGAPHFAEAFELFAAWCFEPGEEITLYQWSGSDRARFVEESEYKQLELSPLQDGIINGNWVDIQQIFDEKAGFERQVSLNIALYATGLMVEGELHDALDDARNTGRIFKMMNDPGMFDEALVRISEYLHPKPLTASIGSMFDFSGIVLSGDGEETSGDGEDT